MLGSSVAYRPYPNYSPWNQFLLYYALCFFVMFFPFLVCDLYYAYNDATCVGMFPVGTDGLRVSFKNWLQVDGYIILGFIVIFLILGVIACCSPQALWVYGLWEGLHMIFILWRLAWLIVGAIMFWHGFAPADVCHVGIARYMWANLIIGFIWLFVELLLAFLYPRSVPIAAPLPIATAVSTPVITQTAFSPTPITAYPTSSALLTPTPGPAFRPGGIVY